MEKPPVATPPERKGFVVFGQALRPLSAGELIREVVMVTVVCWLFSLWVPSFMAPATVANVFLVGCFARAGVRFSGRGLLFILALSFVGAFFFKSLAQVLF